jgi:DNA primase small subunit
MINPSRFEIGPEYNTNPRERKTLRSGQMKPVSKELVFDIDLTDYDDVRTCCAKANICEKCWAFVTMAIKVVDTALRDDFGFEHIMWVYSGRRGAHAWVCDQRARQLPDDRRRAIASYLEIVRGGDKSGKRVNLKRPLHPHISRSIDILKPYFARTTLVDQDAFLSSEQAERLLALLPDKTLNDALRKKWESAPDRPSASKWTDIDALAKAGISSTLNPTALKDAKLDIVLEYTYPRLDSEVSKKMIHLLKSPFVVHPGTGRVCVPIDGRHPEEFNPLTVPTVTELLSEIDAWDAKQHAQNVPADAMDNEGSIANDSDARGARKLQDFEKTSLKPYIDRFRSFIASLIKDEKSNKRERGEEETASGPDAMEF